MRIPIGRFSRWATEEALRRHFEDRLSEDADCPEIVIAYAAWISPTFHLKVIRVFLAVTSPAPDEQPAAAPQAIELFLLGGLRRGCQRLCAWVNAPSVDMR
ncbi:KilA-N domain-containing protein [Burkholderia contaminans]|uniref:KilA-N domain-containing protein n=1 Tax=Burkholderia contaminans TaxID=488447 RepID=UPI001454AB98|nr:KilA-N domain-containing protein [Burkholderia contaminans]VWC73702.1 hypothetical protein BCO18442_00728 [Burkholderia contaminans]